MAGTFGMVYFQVRTVSFRECSVIHIGPLFPEKKTGQSKSPGGWVTKNLQTSKEPRRLALKAANLRLVKERLGEEGRRGKLWPTFLGFNWIWFLGCLIWRAYQSYWCSLCSNCLSGGLSIEPTIFGILYLFRVVSGDLVSWVIFCQHQEAQ